MTTQREVRKAFWDTFNKRPASYRPGRTQNQYSADIRVAFVDYVDNLARSGQITEALAQRITL